MYIINVNKAPDFEVGIEYSRLKNEDESWRCQSSETDTVLHLNPTDTTGTVVDATRTTAFVENTKLIKSEWNGTTQSDTIEVKFMSIKDFLGKPYLVNSFTWNNADALNTVKYQVNPGTLLSSVVPWANKLIGFNLVRGDFHFRIEIIANRFQQGMLVNHYLPNAPNFPASYALMHNATMNGCLQQPHILINASDSGAEITIPYISPTSYYSLKDGTYDWATNYIRVLSPLNSGPSGETFARVNVYAWVENVELAAPLCPQSSSEDTPGPISVGLGHVAKAAGSFARIPMLRSVATSVEWASRFGSGLASVFGWSKPIESTQPHIVARNTWRYSGVSDGADTSVPLGLIHDNELDTKKFSIRKVDEMSTQFLYSIPNYMGNVSWTTSMVSGTSLLQRITSPSVMSQNGITVHAGHSTTWNQGAPVFLLSNIFQFWRGSIKLKIKLIKTEMHKGKLQVTFTPSNSTPLTSPDLVTSIYSLRHIIDVAEKDTFELTMPYMVNTNYLQCSNGLYSGVIDVLVLNELRCPETCAPSIDILYWLEPGDDFEFAVPGKFLNPVPSPFIPQASIEDDTDTIIKGGIGGSKTETLTLSPSIQSVGEHFTSLKQLLNRLSPVVFPGLYPLAGDTAAVWPYFSGEVAMNTTTGALIQPIGFSDAFSMFYNMFAYYRGGVRISISPNNDHLTTNQIPQSTQISLVPYNYPFPTNQVIGTAGGNNMGKRAVLAFGGASGVVNLCPSATETDYGIGMFSAKVPYHSRTPISLCATANTTVLQTPDAPISVVNFSSPTSETDVFNRSTLYRSTMDDFQFEFFVGCPPILSSYL